MSNEEIVKGINKTLDKIRPYLQFDGGDVELSRFEDGIAYVKMTGACAECFMMSEDFDEGVVLLILDENKEVKDVKLESETSEYYQKLVSSLENLKNSKISNRDNR